MERESYFWQVQPGRPDIILFSLIFVLCGIGLLTLFAINSQSSNPYRLFNQQLFSFLVGLLLFVAGLEVSLDWLRRHAFTLVIVALALMLMVFIPGVGLTRGSSSNIPRWIGFPIPGLGFYSFQPVEFAKIAIIVFLSARLTRLQGGGTWRQYLFPLPWIAGLIALTALQPNYGSAFILVTISLTLVFIAGIRIRNILLIILPAIPIIVIGLIWRSYRSDRIMVWLDPYRFPDKSFQILEAFRAFFEGGLSGQILGSARAHRVLPDRHNDFIFAIIAADYGVLGVAAVLSLFMLFTWRAMYILRKLADPFYRICGFGLAFMVIFQAVLNMAVVTGLIPTTGISLPFISLGGSNLMMFLFGMGLLLNISAQEHMRL